jgi:SAM-dependent methyltransferase
MPLEGFDDLAIVDYGCGPGHDLVGFSTLSRPGKLCGFDISPTSLAQAKARLALHGAKADLHQLDDTSVEIPLESNSVDYIHSSGVLHHTSRPDLILQEFMRILKPSGKCRLMVYNHESLWMHLYVAYQKRLVENQHTDIPLEQAFRFFTDGPECPISCAYRPEEWLEIVRGAGFNATYTGAAISLWECQVYYTYRFQALMDERFSGESRDFVTNLTIDSQGYPRHRDTFAGVDACYLLQKR